jgi:hypothetical protein
MRIGPVRDGQQTKQRAYSSPCDCGRCYIDNANRPLEAPIMELIIIIVLICILYFRCFISAACFSVRDPVDVLSLQSEW